MNALRPPHSTLRMAAVAILATLVIFLAAMLPALAFADAPSADPAPSSKLLELVLPHILPIMLSGLGLLISPFLALVGPKLHDLISTKVKNEKLRAILDAVTDAAMVNVGALAQTSVDAAKKAAVDGKVPKDVALAARQAAIEGVQRDLGPALWDALVAALGSRRAAEDAIATRIEAAVAERKIVTLPSGSGVVVKLAGA